MADDPPYLTVGTEVSAKYKGAFCEAKIRKVVRVVKCKVTFKAGNGSALLTDDVIKGNLRIGAVVEAKHPDKGTFLEATINKIQDCSQYTVVFDDGDITTLRRSALCLKSGRHFNESETLDQLPLTHPEHFSNPVVGGRRGVGRRRQADKDDSSDTETDNEPSSSSSSQQKKKQSKYDKELDMGKVVCVESTDKNKKSKDTWFPALVVSPEAQETVKIRIKDEYLVRSFRDGRYYTVPKKEITEFTKESMSKYESNSQALRQAVEKAVLYQESDELPAHWDREHLFGGGGNGRKLKEKEEPEEEPEEPEPEPESGGGSDNDDEELEPEGNEEKDRFIAQLYKFMDDRGTPMNKTPQVCFKDLDMHKLFKTVMAKGGQAKVNNLGQWKQIASKLGYGAMPSTSTINLVKQNYKKYLGNFEEFYRKLGSTWMPSGGSTGGKSRSSRSIYRERGGGSRDSTRDSKKGEDDKEEKEEIKEEPEVKKEEPRKSSRGRQPKKRGEEEEVASPRERKKRGIQQSRERDRDSSVASSTKDKEEGGKNKGVGRGKYKRKGQEEKEKEEEVKKEEETKEEEVKKEEVAAGAGGDGEENKIMTDIRMGDKLEVFYPKSGKTYEAKVIDINAKSEQILVHYLGWNNRYDEWIDRTRISENVTLKMEQSGIEGGISMKPFGGTKRKGRNSSSATSSTSSEKKEGGRGKGQPPSTPQSTPSGKRRRSTSSEVGKNNAGPSPSPGPQGKRRRTRQKSGGEEEEQSSEEDKKKEEEEGGKKEEVEEGGSSNSSGNGGGVLDLNQIRMEMKGIEKMHKERKESPVSSPQPPQLSVQATPEPKSVEKAAPETKATKVDIYEFQEDNQEDTLATQQITQSSGGPSAAPKLKMFSPVQRSTTPSAPSPAPPPEKPQVPQEKEKEVKSSPTVSSSSAEAVAKLQLSQDQEKSPVPLVHIEKIQESPTPTPPVPTVKAPPEPEPPQKITVPVPSASPPVLSIKEVAKGSSIVTTSLVLTKTTPPPPPPPVVASQPIPVVITQAPPPPITTATPTPIMSTATPVIISKSLPPSTLKTLPGPPKVVTLHSTSTPIAARISTPVILPSSLLASSSTMVSTPSVVTLTPVITQTTPAPSSTPPILPVVRPLLIPTPPPTRPPVITISSSSSTPATQEKSTPVPIATVGSGTIRAIIPQSYPPLKQRTEYSTPSPTAPSRIHLQPSTESSSVPTFNIISSKDPPPPPIVTPPPPPKIIASIPPPPIVIKQPPPPTVPSTPPPPKPVYGPGPVNLTPAPIDTPKPKKKRGKAQSTTPMKTLAPLPTSGAPPPPPVIIPSVHLPPSVPPSSSPSPSTHLNITPTPGRKTPVKKRIPPQLHHQDSPLKTPKNLNTAPSTSSSSGSTSKPGKMNSEAMNAAIASVGATPVPTTVITPTSTIYQGHQSTSGVIFTATSAPSAQPPPPPVVVNQPPPPPVVNISKPCLLPQIKSSSESIAASIAAVASMGGSKMSQPISSKSTMPKRFMKDNQPVLVSSGPSTPVTSSKGYQYTYPHQPPPPPVQVPSQPSQPPPAPITIHQTKYQPVQHSTAQQHGPAVTFVKSGPGPSLIDHQHPQQPKPAPVIILPSIPKVIHQSGQGYHHHHQIPPVYMSTKGGISILETSSGGSSSHQATSANSGAITVSVSSSSHQTQQHQNQQPSVLVTSSGSGQASSGQLLKGNVLPITVTPSHGPPVPVPVTSNTVPVTITSVTMTPTSYSHGHGHGHSHGHGMSVELKPVQVQDLPQSITVTKATTVMKSISPDIVAVSSYSRPQPQQIQQSFTPVQPMVMKREEVLVKQQPQIVFQRVEEPKKVEEVKLPQKQQVVVQQVVIPQKIEKEEVKRPSREELKLELEEENSLLCEEIIPGSPTTAEQDEEKKEELEEDQEEPPEEEEEEVKPLINLREEPLSFEDEFSIELAEAKRRRREEMEEDENRSVDSPMGPPSEGREADLPFRDSFSEGGDHSDGGGSSPGGSSGGSSIGGSSGSRMGRRRGDGGSSDDEMILGMDEEDGDSDQGSKSTNVESTRGSTRIREKKGERRRSVSPGERGGKRRRVANRRNKSPEERYGHGGVGRTIRTSSGRKVTPVGRHGDMVCIMDRLEEREKEKMKQPPPPPPVNLTKPPKTGRYNFIPELGQVVDPEQRIGLISQAINELKEQYQKTKQEAASFERRVKRWKRRVREKERLARQEATRATS